MSYFQSETKQSLTGLVIGATGGVVPASDPRATITNFHASSGLWAPIYPWSVANEFLTELPGGGLRLAGTVRTVDRLQRMGARARFRVFPDPVTGLITVRLRLENMAFSNAVASHDCNCGIAWEYLENAGTPIVSMFGLGLSNTNHNTVYAHETIGWNNGPPGIIVKNAAVVGGDGFALADVRVNFTFTIGVGGSDDISASPYEFRIGGVGAYTAYVPATLRCPGYALTKGLEIFCGFFGSQREIITCDMTQFQVEQGYIAL
ncbi:MAG: hypothetical protein WC329_04420 [Candidatus Omnitrophota bacterium]|jgi:hypothetical protein